MSEPIHPALTPEQWAIVRKKRLRVEQIVPILATPADMPRIIALANDGLLKDDPARITWEWIDWLRVAQTEAQDAAWRSCMNGEPGKPCDECQRAVDDFKAKLQRMADALASYLPPAQQ